ncbi:putative phosphoglycerate dehydrogenase [Corynebacterium renale]|uniref:D-isomer specific 2-hydroxyacid dehydrogenase family protein n=1 Tax=Corynebacterium renale TaxID=1724 RepID=UPI000DA2B999|nr:D-isomer specific 2-hydroxyacid dehydrogenase family protein [Corynebacterium renale]SQG65186.1 putative phosphoglycerate dehydrogenase [Corynebacterium renale]STC98238.1 putative phosphoglycerate dehydrogenase [Corynebacterium renale]
MKFTMLPEPWDTVVRDVTEAGHEYVDSLHDADFLIFTGYADGFPELPPSIKFVQTAFAGLDGLAAQGVLTSDVRWANAAGLYADTVAESTLALILGVRHQFVPTIRKATWDLNSQLQEKKAFLKGGAQVTILGAGGIGKELIRMLAPFDVRVVAVNNSGTPVDGAERTVAFNDLSGADDTAFTEADIVVALAPLTKQTKHIVGADVLAAMKPSAIVVNTGRGPLVDTDALVDALRNGEIAGAGLDVTDPEPLPDDHPLWSLDNCLITPHVANTVPNMKRTVGPLTVENARLFEAGEKMATEVDVEAGY